MSDYRPNRIESSDGRVIRQVVFHNPFIPQGKSVVWCGNSDEAQALALAEFMEREEFYSSRRAIAGEGVQS